MPGTPSPATFELVAGSTLSIPSGPSGDHLFVLIFEIKSINNKQKILLAPIESQRPRFDASCELALGDHAFVKHLSFVGYSHSRIEDVDHVLSCLDSGVYKMNHDPVSPALLQRIQTGYVNSKRVPRFIRNEWDTP